MTVGDDVRSRLRKAEGRIMNEEEVFPAQDLFGFLHSAFFLLH
jgi:hypothetical protein